MPLLTAMALISAFPSLSFFLFNPFRKRCQIVEVAGPNHDCGPPTPPVLSPCLPPTSASPFRDVLRRLLLHSGSSGRKISRTKTPSGVARTDLGVLLWPDWP